ncbi:MAG: hypothetical protein C0459_00095 [Chitinophaga sp.]|jgi:hypothetical protein|nr:hypothetical protein [Chitinophaga sp.]
MSIAEQKEDIKRLIDATENETLLMHWKQQLEWDVEHEKEFVLSNEELQLLQNSLEAYEKDNTISLAEFIGKRK